MPIYVYKCDRCGFQTEEYQHIHDEPHTECPDCHEQAFHRVPCLPHSDMVEFRKPIEMQSIGLNHPDDIQAFKAACPDVEISTNPDDDLYGIPIARTRKQKLQALRAMRCVEKN